MRLDPHSLPVRFDAHDVRADGGVRQIELHRERVVLRRALSGMRMLVNVRVSDFLGIRPRAADDGFVIMLAHRDPALSVPLGFAAAGEDVDAALLMWSDALGVPAIAAEVVVKPAQRRRRQNAIKDRRPRFLMRRRVGALLNDANQFSGEREIIARD